jgi:HSP20 family molecular chaperone IbpA
MIKDRSRTWYQVVAEWYNAMRQVGLRYGLGRQRTVTQHGWISSHVISGGPVQAVEETASEVIIIAAFPLLESTEVTLELAGDRLLIQGKSPCASQAPGADTSDTAGNYDVRIRSAILPCVVNLTRASMIQQHNIVRITLPKKVRGHLQQVK